MAETLRQIIARLNLDVDLAKLSPKQKANLFQELTHGSGNSTPPRSSKSKQESPHGTDKGTRGRRGTNRRISRKVGPYL